MIVVKPTIIVVEQTVKFICGQILQGEKQKVYTLIIAKL